MAFKYIELFAGIGGFRSALDALGGDCVFASEIDKYATQAYKTLYNGAHELHGDITKIDAHDVPDHDVLVGGFPCQAFSVAGQRKGFEEARGTLFFEIARIAKTKQPRLMLLENVKGLLSHDGGKTFDTMCAVLNDIGYAVDFRVLNSKHFGVPQNRERIFIVADRDAEHAEWDVTGNDVGAKAKRRAQALGIRTFNFDWPTNDTVTMRLRDVLESNVDEKYYLSEEKTAKLVAQLTENSDIRKVGYITCDKQQNRVHAVDGIMPTITANNSGGRNPGGLIADDSPIIAESEDCIMVGMVDLRGNDSIRRVYSPTGVAPTGVAPTLTTMGGGHREPKIAEPVVVRVGNTNPSGNGMNGSVYADAGLSPTLTTNKGEGVKVAITQNAVLEEVRAVLTPERPEKRQNGRRFKDDGEESFTLTAQDKHDPRYRIRKLTPLECWRLQGFTDAQHNAVKDAGVSDSQRYKQAGNAVTVNVIRAIGERLVARLPQESGLQEAA
ncbi:DNA (cytosine-5-)-methyltransferase [Paenibacillus sediminis]|uniref:Cytosine-specific methyltransferase n=1 Tax=Paenibacillus sediminis TaxID=664909 RepID=A0ABS4H7W3_9BACL|nr:DNA (cytosine-5-)-methyltransferase [Paenibacillus sediminis]MBP1938170.1 DNA (cytosine-5)-methyltransferase 1 [Paenibacillus sediminis]